MGGKAGFGTTPRSFALRVRIVGHASPRWKAAKNKEEADRLNFDLSTKRGDEVQRAVERELRTRLGNGIPIDYAVSTEDPQNPRGIEIGSYGVGSTRPGTGGKDNAEIDRKVEVSIEKITTTYTTGRVSLPTRRVPGKTDSWAMGVTKLRMLSVGGAIGSIELILRNRLTNKQMEARADLYGGGLGGGAVKAGSSAKKQIVNAVTKNLKQAAADFIGRGEVYFSTKNKMGFSDFDGEFIRIGKATGALVIKAVYAYATFPGISHHPDPIVFQHKTSLGLIDLEGWVASGKLHLVGPNPGDYSDYDQDGQVQGSYDKTWGETLILTFPTGKWDMVPNDRTRLTEFVATWVRRFDSPSAP
jgi:hypothetical protein